MGLHNVFCAAADVCVALDAVPMIRRAGDQAEVAVCNPSHEETTWHAVPTATVRWDLMTPFFQDADSHYEVCFNLEGVASFDVALDDPSTVRVDVVGMHCVHIHNDGQQLATLLRLFGGITPLLQADDGLVELYIVQPITAARVVRELPGLCVVELHDREGVYTDIVLAGSRRDAVAAVTALITRL